jgi:hypothetical protein
MGPTMGVLGAAWGAMMVADVAVAAAVSCGGGWAGGVEEALYKRA